MEMTACLFTGDFETCAVCRLFSVMQKIVRVKKKIKLKLTQNYYSFL